MPGKYSHSAVLAEYSSRGIISLPNEQHVAYMRSSPYSSPSLRTKTSLPLRSQSAQPPDVRSYSVNGRSTSTPGNVASSRRRIFLDPSADLNDDWSENGRAENPRPKTSNSARPVQSVSRSHRHIAESKQSDQFKSSPQVIRVASNKQKCAATPWEEMEDVAPIQHGILVHTEVVTTYEPVEQRLARSRETRITAEASISPGEIVKAQPIPARTAPTPSIHEKHNTTENKKVLPFPKKTDLHRQISSKSIKAHTHNPVLGEPDFDGFSDAGETQTSYFDHFDNFTSETGQNGLTTGPILRDLAGEPENVLLQKLPSQTPEVNNDSTRTSLSAQSEQDALPALSSTPKNSSGKLDSLDSESSLGSWGTPSSKRPTKQTEPRRTHAFSPSQNWGLPEIDEDGGFNPDMFTQNFDDVQLHLEEPILSAKEFEHRPLGTISAGRDVTFDRDDDNESELSAAFPPDIGRYRDEEPVTMPPYLQVVKEDEKKEKKFAFTTQSVSKGKIGMSIFSRLRSRSRQA